MTAATTAYARSGVDLDGNTRLKDELRALVASTRTDLVTGGFGAFGGSFALPSGLREPVLVSSVDGVGTKLHLAIEWARPEVAGGDLVRHGLDDVAVQNAQPLAFLDYIAAGELDTDIVLALVRGMAKACREAGVALIGGETAQMPDTYRDGAVDLAGTMIGVAERATMPDVAAVAVGDIIVGLPSSGLHTNGYSLARRTAAALGPEHPVGDGTLVDALLAPHRSYVAELRTAFALPGVRVAAHITGGGLAENMPRVLPDGVGARFDTTAWARPPVFDLIATDQRVDIGEMWRVFNMGIGMAIVADAAAVTSLLAGLPGAFVAGEIIERGEPRIRLGGL